MSLSFDNRFRHIVASITDDKFRHLIDNGCRSSLSTASLKIWAMADMNRFMKISESFNSSPPLNMITSHVFLPPNATHFRTFFILLEKILHTWCAVSSPFQDFYASLYVQIFKLKRFKEKKLFRCSKIFASFYDVFIDSPELLPYSLFHRVFGSRICHPHCAFFFSSFVHMPFGFMFIWQTRWEWG